MNLDKKSDKYRVCHECKNDFMATRRDQLYCNRTCANEYNNRKKRIEKLAQDKYNNELRAEDGTIVKKSTDLFLQSSEYLRNIEILENLNINPIYGDIIPIVILEKNNYIFEKYDNLYELKESSNRERKFCIQVGNFDIRWYNDNEVIIYKKK